MRYKNIECVSITDKGICLLDKRPCVCLGGYCFCVFPHKHVEGESDEKGN
jgi:hypothetical protein